MNKNTNLIASIVVRSLLSTLAGTALLADGCGEGAPDMGTTRSNLSYQGDFSGSQAVPPTASDGSGSISLTLDESTGTVSYTLRHDLKAVQAVQLWKGSIGAAAQGDALFTLKSEAGAQGTLLFSAAQVADLKAGNLYATINTAAVALLGGELRAQLLPLGAQAGASGSADFSAVLTGLQEEPPLLDTATAGSARLTLDDKSGDLSYTIEHALSTATEIDLAQGTVGASGALVAKLGAGATVPMKLAGKLALSAEQRILLKSGLLFVEVKSAGQGVLRGQVLGGGALPFNCSVKSLAGSARGTVHFFLSADGTSLAYRLGQDLQGVVSATLEKGVLLDSKVVCQLKGASDQAQGACAVKAGGSAADLTQADLLGNMLKLKVVTQAEGTLEGQLVVPKQK